MNTIPPTIIAALVLAVVGLLASMITYSYNNRERIKRVEGVLRETGIMRSDELGAGEQK